MILNADSQEMPDCIDLPGSLAALSQSTDVSQDSTSLLEVILDVFLDSLLIDCATIYLLAEDNYTLHQVAQRFRDTEAVIQTNTTYYWGKGLPGRVLAEGKPIYITEPDDLFEPPTHICLPLTTIGQTLGVLDLQAGAVYKYSAVDRKYLETLSRHAAALILANRNAIQAQATTTQLIVFYVFGSRILGASSLQKAFELTVRFILEATPAHSVSIYLFDPHDSLIQSYSRDRNGVELQDGFSTDIADMTYRIRRNKRPVAISGFESNVSTLLPDSLRKVGIAACAGIPLCSESASLNGVLYVRYALPHIFSSMELEGLRLFADQVASVVDRLHLLEQTRQRQADLESVVDTAHILTSTFNISELMQQIAVRLTWVAGADACAISMYVPEQERLHTLAFYDSLGMPEGEQGASFYLSDFPGIGQLLQSNAHLIVCTTDIKNYPEEVMRLRRHNYYTSLSLPLTAIGKPIGLLDLYSRQTDYLFTSTILRRLRLLSEQVALALINARVYQSEHEQRTLAEALREISLALSSSLRSESILEILLDQIKNVIPYDSARVMLVEDNRVSTACQRGYDQFDNSEQVAGLKFYISDMFNLRDLAASGSPLIISDVHAEPEWEKMETPEQIRSWIGVPLMARDRLLGFLTLDKIEPAFYTVEHAKYLEILAAHTALALLNAMTYGEAERASITDFLTGAYNHRHFHQQLQQELERASRIHYPLSLLMIDIDFFKKVNDTYGHPVGDRVLQLLAQRIRTELRSGDILSRYGGEEFTVILPGATEDAMGQVAQRLLRVVSEQPFQVNSFSILITISLGGSSYPQHGQSGPELVVSADQALYTSKHSGRNCYHLFGE